MGPFFIGKRAMPRTPILALRLTMALLVLALPALIVRAQGGQGDLVPILAYPHAPPTPTMGQPPAAAAPPALSSGAAPRVLAPTDLLARWQVVDRPAALPSEGGRWVLRDGLLAQDGVGPAATLSERETLLLSPEPATRVATLFYDMRNGTAALILGYQDPGTFYRLRVHTPGPGAPAETFALERVNAGVVTTLARDAGGIVIDRFTWQTISLQAQGALITAFVGDQPVVQLTDPAPLPAGRAGIATRAFGGIVFSSVTVE